MPTVLDQFALGCRTLRMPSRRRVALPPPQATKHQRCPTAKIERPLPPQALDHHPRDGKRANRTDIRAGQRPGEQTHLVQRRPAREQLVQGRQAGALRDADDGAHGDQRASGPGQRGCGQREAAGEQHADEDVPAHAVVEAVEKEADGQTGGGGANVVGAEDGGFLVRREGVAGAVLRFGFMYFKINTITITISS